jgi:hypothetical protein
VFDVASPQQAGAVTHGDDLDAGVCYAIDEPVAVEQDLPQFVSAELRDAAAGSGKARELICDIQCPANAALGQARRVTGDVCRDRI